MIKRFLLHNIIILFLLNAGSALNYIFQILVGRGLSPEQYGLFNSINSFAAILSLAVTVISYVLAKFIIKYQQRGLEHLRGLVYFSTKWLSLTAEIGKASCRERV